MKLYEEPKLFDKLRHGILTKENNVSTLAVLDRLEDVTTAFDTLEYVFEVNTLTCKQYPEYMQIAIELENMYGKPTAYYKSRATGLAVKHFLDRKGVTIECNAVSKIKFYMGIIQFETCVVCVAPTFPLNRLEGD